MDFIIQVACMVGGMMVACAVVGRIARGWRFSELAQAVAMIGAATPIHYMLTDQSFWSSLFSTTIGIGIAWLLWFVYRRYVHARLFTMGRGQDDADARRPDGEP